MTTIGTALTASATKVLFLGSGELLQRFGVEVVAVDRYANAQAIPSPLRQHGACASAVLLAAGRSDAPRFVNVEKALGENDTELRLFGKPEVRGHRRLGVALARAGSLDEARAKAQRAVDAITVEM